MALADDFKMQAIQWKVANAQKEKADAVARINELGEAANAAIASYGALYIQIPNSGDTAAIYRAILTRYGKEYLKSLGFRVESTPYHADIWWGDPEEVEKQVEFILNPPPVIGDDPLKPQSFSEEVSAPISEAESASPVSVDENTEPDKKRTVPSVSIRK